MERVFEVPESFALPALDGLAPSGGRVVPLPAATVRTTYYDTEDRRLARAGVALWHRRGGPADRAWTLRLPATDISRAGSSTHVPPDLTDLTVAYHRGAPLVPALALRTVRRAHEIRDKAEGVLTELSDDTVSVLDGRRTTAHFREVEVRRPAAVSKTSDRTVALLVDAGAVASSVPTRLRAMGIRPTKTRRVGRKPSAGAVIDRALRADVARIVAHDPYIRLRQTLPNGNSPVHQMRVGARRLRSDLRVFGPLLDPQWASTVDAQVRWLAAALGRVRDVEVLRARLHRTAAGDPVAPLDPAGVARIDAELAARHEDAATALGAVLRSGQYHTLLDLLSFTEPCLLPDAAGPAVRALPGLARKPWRRLVRGGGAAPGAGGLLPDGPDDEWHEVRARGKRARYAADVVSTVVPEAARLSGALARVQGLLGEHQDAAVAADTWLEIAQSDPDDHMLAVTAGRLYERERAAVRLARDAFPAAWRATTKKKVTAWLS